uniref:Retrotransposon gag domain-containing protein n=1 Tax=Tanacetum cinerariifolium TaxID=118510 RepID=A0A6L2P2J5_TANCI|nr:hypothetical protein [Tanacetum cinerariifolium]
MTRSSNLELVEPYKEPERVLYSLRKLFKTTSLTSSSLLEFELFSDHKSQFKEEVTEAMTNPTMEEKFLSKSCPPARTAKRMEAINNFQQELDETLYQAWERFKELLLRCPQHYLTDIHEGDTMALIKDSRVIFPFPGRLKRYGYDVMEVSKDLENLQVGSTESITRMRRLIKEKSRIEEEIETKTDEFIKSSVENLVPNPSEFEDERHFEIYLNPLFDEEIISTKIDPHHFNAESDLIESLLNQDSSIISSLKIDYLLDEFTSELILLKSIPLGIDEADCDPEEEIRLIEKLLYDNSSPRPPKEVIFENSNATIESFSPAPILVEDSNSLRDEIDLILTSDDSMPPGIEDDDYDSERDIVEELLSNDSLLIPENQSFYFDILSSPALMRNHRMMMKLSPIQEF